MKVSASDGTAGSSNSISRLIDAWETHCPLPPQTRVRAQYPEQSAGIYQVSAEQKLVQTGWSDPAVGYDSNP